MTQTALTAVTEVDTTLTALAAYIAAHPTAGVAVYSESGFATPTNANEVAASTFDTNTDLLGHYAGLTAIQQHATVVAATDAARHVFATTPNRKVNVPTGATIWNATTATKADFIAHVEAGTKLYVSELGYRTNIGLFYKILDGTYVNKYIKHEDVEFLLHNTAS